MLEKLSAESCGTSLVEDDDDKSQSSNRDRNSSGVGPCKVLNSGLIPFAFVLIGIMGRLIKLGDELFTFDKLLWDFVSGFTCMFALI